MNEEEYVSEQPHNNLVHLASDEHFFSISRTQYTIVSSDTRYVVTYIVYEINEGACLIIV